MWRAFPYSKRPFVINLALLLMVLLIIVYLMLTISADLFTLMAIIVMGFAFLFVLGISPLFTDHEIEDGTLVLRQGWYFRARVPMHDVREVRRLARGPSRTGVFFSLRTPTLYVTTSKRELIEIVLTSERSFPWALGKRADHIVFDARDLDPLVRLLEENITPASPSPAS